MNTQDQIEIEAGKRYVNFGFSDCRYQVFKDGCEFGYSVSQDEIKRLKLLIKDLYINYSFGIYKRGDDVHAKWDQFKIQHNL